MCIENETSCWSEYYESVNRIIEDPFDCEDVFGYINKTEEQLEQMVKCGDIKDYKISTEIMNASGKNGEPAYYVSITWIDRHNALDVCSGKITFNS